MAKPCLGKESGMSCLGPDIISHAIFSVFEVYVASATPFAMSPSVHISSFQLTAYRKTKNCMGLETEEVLNSELMIMFCSACSCSDEIHLSIVSEHAPTPEKWFWATGRSEAMNFSNVMDVDVSLKYAGTISV